MAVAGLTAPPRTWVRWKLGHPARPQRRPSRAGATPQAALPHAKKSTEPPLLANWQENSWSTPIRKPGKSDAPFYCIAVKLWKVTKTSRPPPENETILSLGVSDDVEP